MQALVVGAKLGSYEILSSLGAGGMGEVYRARDTKLGRDVALKTLPASFTHDPERVARFKREAQMLATLNHPNIAGIYGIDEAADSSSGDTIQFLTLELVDGETLAERLTHGALPVKEAIDLARQIADALQAAHEKGIIHRDLKPANIALTADGQVKVLDFGLAKALEHVAASEARGSEESLLLSPTITSPAMTQAGMILGTAAYMSPEQAKGHAADKRSDVWAFGCVLYEMLTAKRAFEGEDVSDTLAAVLRGEPDWTALPKDLPHAIALLIRRCVEPASGGEVELVIKIEPDQQAHGPQMLPDGEHVLFTLLAGVPKPPAEAPSWVTSLALGGPMRWDKAQIVVQALRAPSILSGVH